MKVALLPAGHDPTRFLRAVGRGGASPSASTRRAQPAVLRARSHHHRQRRPSAPRGRVNTFNRGGADAGQGRRRRGGHRARRARPRCSSASTPPSSGSRPSGCRPPCGPSRPAAAGTARAADAAARPVRDRSGHAPAASSPRRRAALLPLVEAADVAHKGLWAILGALQQHPERPAEALMAELEAQDDAGSAGQAADRGARHRGSSGGRSSSSGAGSSARAGCAGYARSARRWPRRRARPPRARCRWIPSS